MNWPDGRRYGRLVLYYSPVCEALWGYATGPNSETWTVHIDVHRQSDRAVAPASFSGRTALPGSWGNVLSDLTGCVYAEGYVVKGGAAGPHARTACVQGSGSVTHTAG
ncbi:hypothetical protein ACFOOM_09845 [Streptomyces echinoruber]|uniref:Uncharacterized protein n=1 Tax=Streptomyces echinoruber TaxID=68898 RepID=A0A918RML0_9ACTN|nr:hypothetical protein [Streptomyces echinoruber]GHA02453.1 hypothetical protein GCM10010389_47360 [Streptomyces echinoruber]